MYKFTIPTINPTNSLELLHRWGVVHIPNYLSSSQIESLIQEFETSFHYEAAWLKSLDYSVGKAASITREKIDRALFPITAEVFGDPFMAEITDHYLGKPNLLNHEIFLVKDVVGSQHVAQDLHYDKIPTLKFFIYLNDTTADNGAFHCIPQSQTWTRKQQEENRLKNIRPERDETRIIPEKLAKKAIPIEGKAGTLIIFHTDTLHHAGTVKAGERWVMRGHSRIPKHLQPDNGKALSKLWKPLKVAKKAWHKIKAVQPLQ